MYSFSGNSAASAPIATFMCVSDLYSVVPGSVYIFPPAEYADRSWEYINRSQMHECGNWDWDPDIPFLGIFVSKFRYFVFAVHKPRIRCYRFKRRDPETEMEGQDEFSLKNRRTTTAASEVQTTKQAWGLVQRLWMSYYLVKTIGQILWKNPSRSVIKRPRYRH